MVIPSGPGATTTASTTTLHRQAESTPCQRQGLGHRHQPELSALDPKTHTVTSHEVPRRDGPGRDPERLGRIQGNTSSHNPMLDDKGNVWLTTAVRNSQNTPKWAADVTVDIAGSGALNERGLRSSRQLGYFDSNAEKFVLIDTAFATHHLQFDREGRLWTSGDNTRLGMFDPRKVDPSRPEETASSAQVAFAQIDATGRSHGRRLRIIVARSTERCGAPTICIFGRRRCPTGGNYIQVRRRRKPTALSDPLPGWAARIDATTMGACGSNRQRSPWLLRPGGRKVRIRERPTEDQGTGKEIRCRFHYYICRPVRHAQAR